MNIFPETRMRAVEGTSPASRTGLFPAAPDAIRQAEALRDAAALMRATKQDVLRRIANIRGALTDLPAHSAAPVR